MGAKYSFSDLDGKSVVLAGPMRGIDDFNRKDFGTIEGIIHAAGATEVWNPTMLVPAMQKGTMEFGQCMRVDLTQLLKSDIVVMLDGWEDSAGAKLEHDVAETCNIEIVYSSERQK